LDCLSNDTKQEFTSSLDKAKFWKPRTTSGYIGWVLPPWSMYKPGSIRDQAAEAEWDEPRSYQYTPNINATITPRAAYGLTPFSTLKFYAENVPEAALAEPAFDPFADDAFAAPAQPAAVVEAVAVAPATSTPSFDPFADDAFTAPAPPPADSPRLSRASPTRPPTDRHHCSLVVHMQQRVVSHIRHNLANLDAIADPDRRTTPLLLTERELDASKRSLMTTDESTDDH
jgi:hypothetical protein